MELYEIVCFQSTKYVNHSFGFDDDELRVAYMAYIDSKSKEIIDDLDNISEGTALSLGVDFGILSEGNYKYTKNNLVDAVMEVYLTLPLAYCGPSGTEENKKQRLHYCNEIAKQTRRGSGTEVFPGLALYKGNCKFETGKVDGGLIVSEATIDGDVRYAIYQHPLFERYGFILIDEDNPNVA